MGYHYINTGWVALPNLISMTDNALIDPYIIETILSIARYISIDYR